MFSGIAKRYDLLNHLLSLGLDITWRRRAVGLLGVEEGTYVLDIATGTADLAIESVKQCPNCNIIGIDISKEMIELGKKKVKRLKLANQISLKTAAAENLGEFENEVFDYATVAFGVRNFSDLDKGLSEIHRVLKPGARFLILEFSIPRVPVFGTIYRYYFTKILPAVGGLLSNRSTYTEKRKKCESPVKNRGSHV